MSYRRGVDHFGLYVQPIAQSHRDNPWPTYWKIINFGQIISVCRACVSICYSWERFVELARCCASTTSASSMSLVFLHMHICPLDTHKACWTNVRQINVRDVERLCSWYSHLPLAGLTRVLLQEPGRIEYYNRLFCLCGHLGGVSEIQTSLDVSDL